MGSVDVGTVVVVGAVVVGTVVVGTVEVGSVLVSGSVIGSTGSAATSSFSSLWVSGSFAWKAATLRAISPAATTCLICGCAQDVVALCLAVA